MTSSPKRAKRRYLIIPLALFALAFAAYSAVWVYGSGIMRTEVDKFIEAERALGREISYDGRKIVGYPFALRTKIDGFAWEEPGNWRWSGERLYIVTLPYDVTRIILAPRRSQQVVYGGETYAINGVINVGLKENAYSADMNDVTITSNQGTFGIGKFAGNWDAADDGSWEYKAALRQFIYTDPSAQSAEIPYLNLRAQSGGDSNDRIVLNGSDMAVTDGTDTPPTQIRVTGDVAIDGFRQLEGDMTIGLRNEAALIGLAQRYGALNDTEAAQAKGYLSGATANGTQDAEFPISFRDGNVVLQTVVGPVTLGEIGPVF